MDDRREIEEEQNEQKIKRKKSNRIFALAITAIIAITEPLAVVFSIFIIIIGCHVDKYITISINMKHL